MTVAKRIDRLERNLLINGGFQWFQRNTGAVALTGTASYLSVDRWRLWYANNGTAPTSILATDVPTVRTKRSLSFSINASNSNAQLYASQRIEALKAMDVAGDTISFGIKVKSASARAITLMVAYPSAENNFTTTTQFYSLTKTITNDGVWQLVEFEGISVPTSAINGLMVTVMLSDFGVLGTSQNHYLGEAIANIGDDASAFQWAGHYADFDLLLCQALYQKTYNLDVNPGTVTLIGARTVHSSSVTNVRWMLPLISRMSFTPTIHVYNGSTGTIDNLELNGSNYAASYSYIGQTCFMVTADGTAANSNGSNHFTADAEI